MGGFKPSAKSFKKSTSTAEAAVEATLATPFSSMFCTGTDDEGEENGGARGAKCGGGGGGGGGAISCAGAAAIVSSPPPNVSKNAASSSFPANNPSKFALC